MGHTTRVSQIREKLKQHQKNKDSIRYLQHQNCQIEVELVEIMVHAGRYDALNINKAGLNHFLREVANNEQLSTR